MANISLMKRGSSWQYRFDVVNPEGKRTQISKAGFKTEAREAGLEAIVRRRQEVVQIRRQKVAQTPFQGV